MNVKLDKLMTFMRGFKRGAAGVPMESLAVGYARRGVSWVRLLNLVPPSDVDLGGFIIAGVWKSLGVSHERLERPYSEGHSVFHLTEVAMDCGAWRCRPKNHMPLPGDVAVLSDGSPEGAHALVVTHIRPGDPMFVKSVEGSVSGVYSRVRSWRGSKDLSDGRCVLGWIDVASLPIPSAFQS